MLGTRVARPTTDSSLVSVPLHPGQLPTPRTDADRSQKAPITQQRKPAPARSALEEIVYSPHPGIPASQAPFCPGTDHAGHDERSEDIESGSERALVDQFFVGEAEAAVGLLGNIAGDNKEWRQEEPSEKCAWDESELEYEKGRREPEGFDVRYCRRPDLSRAMRESSHRQRA